MWVLPLLSLEMGIQPAGHLDFGFVPPRRQGSSEPRLLSPCAEAER